MGNLLPQSLYHQGDLSENTNQIADHDDDDLTIVDEKDKNETYETAIESVYFHNRILVEAYVRSIEEWVLYAIVADPIKQLICRYYNSWMKLPPPPKTTLVYPDPICYYSSAKQRDYIVFAPHVQDSKDLIQFDTKQHKWSVLTQYPDGFECSSPGFVHDTFNQRLYFCFGYGQVFGWFDLQTNAWTVKCSRGSRFDGDPAQFGIQGASSNPTPTCFVSDLNEIHAITTVEFKQNIHMKYSKLVQKFEKCSDFGTKGIRNAYIVYIAKQQIMLSIGGLWGTFNANPCDKMYYCRIKEDHDGVWHSFGCTLPYSSIIHCQLMLDTLLIGYFEDEKELWCLDLDVTINRTPQWIKCHEFDLEESYYHIVATQKGFIHFVDAFTEKHCKVHLSQILSDKLYAKYYSI
eukprot:580849_1